MSTKTAPTIWGHASWAGTLALLRRMAPQHLGRVVVIEGPALSQSDSRMAPTGTPCRLPACHAYVFGARLRLEGDSWRAVNVAEPCLQPLCRLRHRAAKAVIRVQALRDADEALAELSDWLAAHPISGAALDNLMERAASEAFGPRQWPLIAVHHY